LTELGIETYYISGFECCKDAHGNSGGQGEDGRQRMKLEQRIQEPGQQQEEQQLEGRRSREGCNLCSEDWRESQNRSVERRRLYNETLCDAVNIVIIAGRFAMEKLLYYIVVGFLILTLSIC